MILNLISLATVKTQLGLTDTTYDARITAMLPIVSSDVRRILNYNFDSYFPATITDGSAEIDLYHGDRRFFELNEPMYFDLGQVIYNPNLPDDTYLQSYNPDTGIFTMSGSATGAGDYVYLGLKVSQWPTVSKMIFYRISKQNTTSVSDEKLSSYSYGPVSKTYAESEINKKWNYPQSLIDDLGTPYVSVI